MGYLQPWMLWALPAVLLPLLIHLLNRLRFKTVHWAAMLFLLKANRAATRRAKLRQYLLLASRMLVVLFLIWAMARPLIGGWLGSAAGGASELVIILLDRSASMEASGATSQESKRAHALALLTEAAKQSRSSRFVLIENVLRQPLEIAAAAGLAELQMTESTDTGADLPAMFRTALDYLTRNRPGSAEVWVASDLQASNWRPDSAEWRDISARFSGLPQEVRVRVLDLSTASSGNLSVAVKAADLRVKDAKTGQAELGLGLEIERDADGAATAPLRITREGTTSQKELALSGPVQRQVLKFDLLKPEPGWGKVELPADSVISDNTAYFAYSQPQPLHSAIVADGLTARRLQFAAAPDPTRPDHTAELLPILRASDIRWKATALLVWAGGAPSVAVAESLKSWVESGGVLLCLPTGGQGGPGPLGITWSAPEAAERNAPFRVTSWDDMDGPLARTESGASLPIPRLEVARRQTPAAGETAHAYGSFADGRPFLLGMKVGAGQVFVCATLPEAEWSTLGEGVTLLPMVQRMLALGGQRFTPPRMAIAGEWKPEEPQQIWTAAATDRRRDWRWHAGIYQSGTRLVALNRPAIEDSREIMDRARLPDILKGVKLRIMAGALELKADGLQSEIWPAMVIVAMIFMCVEMLLATSKAMLPMKPNISTPKPQPRPEPAGARA